MHRIALLLWSWKTQGRRRVAVIVVVVVVVVDAVYILCSSPLQTKSFNFLFPLLREYNYDIVILLYSRPATLNSIRHIKSKRETRKRLYALSIPSDRKVESART